MLYDCEKKVIRKWKLEIGIVIVTDVSSRVAEKIGIFLPCLFLPVNYWTTVWDGKLPGHMCHVFYEGALMVQYF